MPQAPEILPHIGLERINMTQSTNYQPRTTSTSQIRINPWAPGVADLAYSASLIAAQQSFQSEVQVSIFDAHGHLDSNLTQATITQLLGFGTGPVIGQADCTAVGANPRAFLGNINWLQALANLRAFKAAQNL